MALSEPALPASHAELAACIQAGSPAAAEDLVQRFGRGVRIILGRLLSQRAAVDDAFQDTFRLVLEKVRRGELREPERLPGFVASLARNVAIDLLRRQGRRGADDVEAALHFADPGPSPLQRLLDDERAALARRVIEGLGQRDREVLYQFYIAEEAKESICRRLELTSLHFNRVLHRARQRYKELFQEAARRPAGPAGER